MNLTRFVIALVLGVLIGLTYFGVQPTSFTGVNSFLAGTFMALLFGPSLSSIAALPTMFRQRAIFYRECTVRMYDTRVYQLTLTVAELLALALLMMAYVLPHYWLMGLNTNAHQFWRFYLVVFLMAQVYASFSQLYLAYLPNQVAAAVVHAIVFAFFFVFGGLLITAKAYPVGFKWSDPHIRAHTSQQHFQCSLTHATRRACAPCICVLFLTP
jgi:ATP-binding cassette subfamily G (WHITE) protein 2 (SNQ2)